jgi:hypothetical protein
MLANRLAPELKNLISHSQNAFIMKRYIHDNFMFVHQMIKELHRKKVPTFFMKLDISKAFNTVSWSYLIDIMSFLGFGIRWRNWVSALWASTSSSFLINGYPGRRICHKRGVRQGGPLSPMLFLLAMELLYLLFQYVQSMGALSFLHGSCARFRVSLYVSDATVFINPSSQDLYTTMLILRIFGQASGLVTNMEKTELYPIRCQDINLDQLLDTSLRTSSFPCSYLGLPLHYKKLPRSMISPLVQKIDNKLSGWKRNLLSYLGRETLVKMVLSAMTTHFLTVHKLPKWVARDIDRFR